MLNKVTEKFLKEYSSDTIKEEVQEEVQEEAQKILEELSKKLDKQRYKSMLNKVTEGFLKEYSSDTIKEEEHLIALEEQLLEDSEILEELSKKLDKQRYRKQEDLSVTFKDIEKELNKIEKVYNKILNKYDLKSLIAVSIECLNKKLPFFQVQKELCKNILRNMLKNSDLDKVKEFISLFRDIESFILQIGELLLNQTEEVANSAKEVDDLLSKIDEIASVDSLCELLSLNFDSFKKILNIGTVFEEKFLKYKNQLPKVPTFKLLDNIPTVDFLSFIQENLEKNIKSTVVTFSIRFLSSLLQQIIHETCIVDSPLLIKRPNKTQELLVNRFGDNASDLSSLVDKMATTLSSAEFCGLLKGKLPSDVFIIVSELVNTFYPDLKNLLNDRESMIDFFVLLSEAVDLEICEDIIDSGGNFGPCFDNDRDSLKKCLLGGVGFDKNQVEALLEKIKSKHLNDLQNLFNILEETEVKDFNINNLCRISEDDILLKSIKKGLSLTTETILDGLLDSIGMSYDHALLSYVSRLLKEVEINTEEDETLLNLTEKVVDLYQDEYNKQYNKTFSSLNEDNKRLKDIIEGSLDGDKKINDFLDMKGLKNLQESSFGETNKRKKVQPDLLERIKRENTKEFCSVNTGIIDFSFPSDLHKKIAEVFKGKLFERSFPKQESNDLKFSFDSSIDVDGNIKEDFNILYIAKQKILSPSVKTEKDCNTNKVIVSPPKEIDVAVVQNEYNSTKPIKNKIKPQFETGFVKEKRFSTEESEKWTDKNNEIFKNQKIKSSNKKFYASVWSNMIIDSLKKKFNDISPQEEQQIHSFYKNNGYDNIHISFIKRIGEFVSLSPLFNTIETTTEQTRDFSIKDLDKDRGLSEVNLLEFINFSPKIKSGGLDCNIDVDLMRLSEVKRKALDDYTNIAVCFEEKDSDKQLNLVLSSSVVQILIRLYVVEFVLSSIFFFSKIHLDASDIENFLSLFICSKIEKEIILEQEKRRDDKFLEQFYEIVGSLYLNKIKSNESNIDCKKALQSLVSEQLVLVSNRLRQLLYKPDVIQSNNFSIKSFQDKLFPFVALPESDLDYRNKGGRFVEFENRNLSSKQKDFISRRFVNIEDVNKLINKYNTEENGFFFETYVKPSYKKEFIPPQNKKVLNGFVNIESFNEYLNFIKKKDKNNFIDYFDDLKVGVRLLYRPTQKEKDLLRKIITKRSSKLNYETKDYFEPGDSETPNHFLVQQTVRGVRKAGLIEKVTIQLFWKTKTEKDTQKINKMLRTNKWDLTLLTSENKTNNKINVIINGRKNYSFEEYSKLFKLYSVKTNKLYTNSDIVEFIDDFLYTQASTRKSIQRFRNGFVSSPLLPPTKYYSNKKTGESVIIPILYEEESIINKSLSNITEISSLFSDNKKGKDDCEPEQSAETKKKTKERVLFDRFFEECLKERLVKSLEGQNDYKLIFDNLFPISKLSSMFVLYMVLYNRSTTSIDSMFNNVKNNIFSLLENIENIDNVKFKDNKRVAFNDDVGILASGNNLNLDSENSRFFDIDYIRNSTPYIMLKGLVETFDPNISLSKKIVDVANSYKKKILNEAKPLLQIIKNIAKGLETLQEEKDKLISSQWVIDLAKEFEKVPDLSIQVPSIFLTVTGLIPSPLGFAYLAFENIVGKDLLEKIKNNSILEQKIEFETGVSMSAAREFSKTLQNVCLGSLKVPLEL